MRFLIADDDNVNCCILEEILSQSGHEVVIVNDGQQAWDALQREDAPQIAILDWLMPEMDGVELCKKLRQSEEGRKLYLILLTSRESEEHFITGFNAGADDYIVKPFGPRQLLARLQAGIRVIELQNNLDLEKERLRKIADELSAANCKLEKTALTDVLTGLPNRRHLIERLSQEWSASKRNGAPLSCMMIDVDRFKQINDTHGHDIGDLVLRAIAGTLQDASRKNDIACRYGGEEFIIVCPDSDLESATVSAERIRATIDAETHKAFGFVDRAITVSIGVSQRDDTVDDADQLVKIADESLYCAKKAGRNRVHGLQRKSEDLTVG